MKYLFIVTTLFLSVDICANSISMKQFIKLAERNDPNFEKIVADKNKKDFLVDQGMPSRQILFSLQNEYGIVSGSDKNNSSLSAAISKKINSSGTNISLSQTNDEKINSKENKTSVKIEQSLFKDFAGRDVRLKEKILNKQKDVLELQILDSYEDYVNIVANIYLDFAQSYIDLTLANEVYKEALNLEKNVLAKKKKSIATQVDVDRVQLQMVLRKEDILSKEIKYAASKEQVRQLLGDDFKDQTPEVDTTLLKHITPDVANDQLSLNSLRVYNIQQSNEDIATQELTLAKRDLYPEVDLYTGGNFTKTTTASRSVTENETVIGVNINIPLGDSKGSADKKSASLDLIKTKIQRRILENNIREKFFATKHQLTKLNEKLALGRRKIELTKRILKEEEQRYRYAKNTLEKIIEIRNDFVEYRFMYHSDLIEFNKVYYGWLNLKDMLLVNNK